MTTTYHPSVHKFAIFVVCWTILLLIAGALVTSNEAALSVPDWPLPTARSPRRWWAASATNTLIA
jgi:heme A synthase